MIARLPSGWEWTTIAEIGEVTLGRQRSPEHHQGLHMRPYLRVANVYEARIDTSDVLTMNFSPSEFEKFRLVPGDVLLNEGQSLELVGRAAIYRGEVPGACFQNTLLRFRARVEALEPRFALAIFRAYLHLGEFRKLAKWTTSIAHLGAQRFADMRFPLPPLPEQHRIVAALDSYLSRLDAAEAALRRARANLVRYRASVLQAAVEGRLVPTEAELARGEGRSFEPASKLLERILIERRRRWEEAELAKRTAAGKVPKDDRWKQKYEEPAGPDVAALPVLPEGWCWATVGQLSASLRNGYSQAPDAASGVRILRISAVRPLRVDLSDHRFLSPNHTDLESFLLNEGDLLFTRYNGSPALVGVCGRVGRLPAPTLYPDKLIRVRMIEPYVHVGLAGIFASAGASRQHIERRTRTTAGQAGISGSDLKQMPFPLPPAAEQERIANGVEAALAAESAVQATLEANIQRTTRLRQSILKWAFEGRLVDQDPNDEPASELLARIRALTPSVPLSRPARKPAHTGEGEGRGRGRGRRGGRGRPLSRGGGFSGGPGEGIEG